MKKIIQFLMGCSISISLVSCAKNEVRPSDLKNVTVDYKKEYKELIANKPDKHCKGADDVNKCKISLPECANENPDSCIIADPLFSPIGYKMSAKEYFISYLHAQNVYKKACKQNKAVPVVFTNGEERNYCELISETAKHHGSKCEILFDDIEEGLPEEDFIKFATELKCMNNKAKKLDDGEVWQAKSDAQVKEMKFFIEDQSVLMDTGDGRINGSWVQLENGKYKITISSWFGTLHSIATITDGTLLVNYPKDFDGPVEYRNLNFKPE